jgi:hypothetical protein
MIETYLNQTATWKARTTVNDYGESSYAATTINCRIVTKKRMLITEKGGDLLQDTVVYTTSAVQEGDLIDDKVVVQVYIRQDISGTEKFRECRLGSIRT